MQAVILAGGLGTRLRPLTLHMPKPVVPVCNQPFLRYQLDALRSAGVTDVTLALSYQPHKIEQIMGDGSEFGVHLKYTTEPEPLGTAGAYRFAAADVRRPAVIFNGDILTDLDVGAVIRQHQERGAAATIVLQPVADPSAYGLVETDADARVLRFREKPKPEELASLTTNLINAGTYILEPEVLDLIAPDVSVSFEYDVFPELLRRGLDFYSFAPKANENVYWMDLGTPERYIQAHHDLLAGRVRSATKIEPTSTAPAATAGVGAQADDAPIISNSLIADNCMIKPGARITDSVLGEGCVVEEGAQVSGTVLWAHTRIGANSQVSDAILGRGCHVGRDCRVGAGTVLGDKTSLTDYTRTGAIL